MDTVALRDIIYIGGIILSAVITFISTRHKLKEMIRDKHDENTRSLTELRIEIERLKGKDELQQQVIDQFKNLVLENLPKVFQLLERKEYAREK